MAHVARLTAELMAMHGRKPALGALCNSCGFCCASIPCPLSVQVFRRSSGRCIALEKHGDKFLCGLVTDPARYLSGVEPDDAAHVSAHVATIIDAGGGCDAGGIIGFARITEGAA